MIRCSQVSPRFVREVELASSPPRGIHRQTAQSVDVCYQRPSRVTYRIWTRVGHLGPYLSVPRPGIITKYVAAPFAPEEHHKFVLTSKCGFTQFSRRGY